jgi:hypothetical protein
MAWKYRDVIEEIKGEMSRKKVHIESSDSHSKDNIFVDVRFQQPAQKTAS